MGYCNFRKRVTEMFLSYEFWLAAAFAGIIAVLIVKMCENKRAKEKGSKKIPEENDERYN